MFTITSSFTHGGGGYVRHSVECVRDVRVAVVAKQIVHALPVLLVGILHCTVPRESGDVRWRQLHVSRRRTEGHSDEVEMRRDSEM